MGILGTLTKSQIGNVSRLETNANNNYNGNAPDEMRPVIQFSTTNGITYTNKANK